MSIILLLALLVRILPAIVGVAVVGNAVVRGQFHESGKPLMLIGLAFTLTCPVPFFAFGFLFGAWTAASAGVTCAVMWFLLGIVTVASGLVIKVAYLR